MTTDVRTEQSIRVIREINRRYLFWLARSTCEGGNGFGSELNALDETALHRLAQFPMLLSTYRFDDLPWWTRRIEARTPACVRQHVESATMLLAREVLTAVWCMLDGRPEFYCLTGVTAAVAGVLRQTNLDRLIEIVRAEPEELQPRWANTALVWQRLALASRCDRGWEEVRLHALQLC